MVTICDHDYECVEDAVLDLDLLISTYLMANVYLDHRFFIRQKGVTISFQIKTVE